jgi:hypothetical protein
VIIPMATLVAALTFVWPFVRGETAFVLISIFYGIGCGAYVGICANPILLIGDTEDVGRRAGIFFVAASLGAMVGPPISGRIGAASRGFEAEGYFAGASRFQFVWRSDVCSLLRLLWTLQARRLLWPWCSWVSVVIWSYESFGISLEECCMHVSMYEMAFYANVCFRTRLRLSKVCLSSR